MRKKKLPAVLALLALFILYGLCATGTGPLDHWRFPDAAGTAESDSAAQDADLPVSTDSTDPDSSAQDADKQDVDIHDGSGATKPDFKVQDRPYVRLNGDVPFFTEEEISNAAACIRESAGTVSPGEWMLALPLDELGRCQAVTAVVGPETIPAEERESIREIEPSGWKQAEYDWIEGRYLYNRCHLVGYQLCGVSADERNLVTGTHYLNITGMQPWEDWVAEYVCRTAEHVLYRATPIFDGENPVASGIQMEAEGLENSEFHFCVYCFNIQPGIRIDYRTGLSEEEERRPSADIPVETDEMAAYILNTNSGKFHYPGCEAAQEIAWRNRIEWIRGRDELRELGYMPCGLCRP